MLLLYLVFTLMQNLKTLPISQTLTMAFVFSLVNNPWKASTMLSNPSVMCSRYLSLPWNTIGYFL